MGRYAVKRVTSITMSISDADFIYTSGDRASEKYKGKFSNWSCTWSSNRLLRFADENLLLMCYRDQEPVGFLIASFYYSFFDASKILQQNLLYSLPNTRAANLLLKEFVDFGRLNAKHVITMIAKETNIKPRSLERMGFSKLEELYSLEV